MKATKPFVPTGPLPSFQSFSTEDVAATVLVAGGSSGVLAAGGEDAAGTSCGEDAAATERTPIESR